ncbi:MAG: Set1/Ash2 histone methyltransferase complex subunit ASH2 [Marteilia pararefringens]
MNKEQFLSHRRKTQAPKCTQNHGSDLQLLAASMIDSSKPRTETRKAKIQWDLPILNVPFLSDTDCTVYRLARQCQPLAASKTSADTQISAVEQKGANVDQTSSYSSEIIETLDWKSNKSTGHNKITAGTNASADAIDVQHFVRANDDSIFRSSFSPCRTSPLLIDLGLEASKFGTAALYRSNFLDPKSFSPGNETPEFVLKNVSDFGYSSAQVECLINEGFYYYDVTHSEAKFCSNVDDQPDPACRFGFAHSYFNLQTPAGHCTASYSLRTRDCAFFSNSKRIKSDCMSEERNIDGDRFGALIFIPPNYSKKIIDLHKSLKSQPLVQYKNHYYFSDSHNPMLVAESLKNAEPMFGSYIEFFKNGKSLGRPFKDLPLAVYYPTVSLYSNCVIVYNFSALPPESTESRDKCFKTTQITESIRNLNILHTILDLFHATCLL